MKKLKIINQRLSFKLLYLLLIGIAFGGCEKNLYDEHLYQEKINSQISLEQFKRETGLTDFTPNIKINPNITDASLQRNADGSYELSDFIIDTSVIKRLVVDEKITYTFQIIPIEPVNDRIFNIVYYFKEGWQYDILEIKPKPENLIQLKAGTTKDIDGTISNIFRSTSVQSFSDCNVYTIWVENCQGCTTGVCDECAICSYHVTILLCGGGPADFYLDAGPSISAGGGGGDSGVVHQYIPPNPPNPEQNQIATAPVIATIEPIDDEPNPCLALESKDQIQEFTDKLSELKTKSGTQNFETGYMMFRNPDNSTSFSQQYNGNPNGADAGKSVDFMGVFNNTPNQTMINTLGFMHSHLDNGTTYKIFSMSDILAFSQLANYNTAVSGSEMIMYVVTNSGTFAMKISSRQKVNFKNRYNDLLSNFDSYETFYMSFVTKSQTVNNQKLNFLKFLAVAFSDGNGKSNLGLDLFEKGSNGIWNKLELTTNGTTINEIPCH